MGADALIPPLPPGFQADPPPPPGFQLDAPRAAPPAAGLAPRTGAAAIPTAEEAATGVYTPPPTAPPRPEPGIKERVLGAAEAGLELLAQFTGGGAGLVVGTAEGIGRSVLDGTAGTAAGAQQAQQVAAQRAEQGVQLVRRGLGAVSPVAGLVQAAGGGLGEQMSPAGQEAIEGAQGVINSLPAAGGVYGTMQGPGMMAAGGVRPMLAKGLEGPTAAIKAVAEQVADRVAPAADAAAGAKPSAGAAGADPGKIRRERAAALPRPVPLTKGDATRELGQQQLERDIAKDADAGRDVRTFRAGQDERVAENFDILEEQTGAEKTTAEGAGDTVVGVLEGRKKRKLDEIRGEYEKARQAGETAELVPTDELVQLLNESRSSERNAGVIGTAADELVRLGGAVRDKDGYLLPSTIDINALEEVRKTIGAGGKKDATNSLFASRIRERIDSVLDDAGGDVYKGARRLYADYAKEFSNQGVLRDLLASKKGTTDRTVAMERVYRRIVGEAAPVQDLRNLKRTLQAEGDAGKRAWGELQGEAIRQLREATFRTRAKNERGMKLASDAGLNNALKQLDRNGKLDELFGKQGAQTLRDLGEVVADVYTPTADVTNPSGTGAYVKRMLIDLATSFGTGVPAPFATISKFVSDWRQGRKTRRAVGEALAQPDAKALERRADTGARPFELPPGEAATPRETPPTGPKGGGGGGGAPMSSGSYRDGGKWSATYRTVARSDGTHTLVRDFTDSDGTKVQHLGQDGAWQDGEPAKTAVSGVTQLSGPEAFPDAQAALKFAADFENAKPQAATAPARANKAAPEREAPAAGASKRERELMRLREQTTDADVIKDLDAEIAAERKRETARKKGEEYLRLADQTNDPELRRRLEKKAADLGARREKIPTGRARELSDEEARALQSEPAVEPREPMGDGVEVTEVMPEVIDAVAAFTANAEARADWQRTHRFGDLDARTAEDVARALQYDAAATEGAVQQLERSPRAFEREIKRIIEEGDARARETQQATGGGEGSAGAPGQDVPPRVPAGQGQPRADGDAAAAAQRGEPAGTGRQPGSVGGEAVRRAAAYLNDRPEIPAPLREGILERYRLAERAKPAFDERVRAAAAQLGSNVAEILLAPIKFPTRAVAKILADYRGDPKGIKDLVRGTIVLRDIGSAKDALAALEKHLGKLEGLRNSLDEALPAPTEDGYRDIKANVVIDGLPTEIQVNVPEMIAAKKEAHPLYERVAEIERKADAEQRDLTPEEAAERQELKDRQRRIYDSAWEAATRLRKSASDSKVPLREIDSSGKRLGSSASNARGEVPPSSATGTPSTSKNLVPAGKDLGSSTGITSATTLADTPAGRQTIATTERGVEIPVLYRAVDVGQLITSHDNTLRVDPRFPAQLQPRDRSRQASELQITKIENDIKPNLLAESYKASDGAPIVGADGVVESGNARTIALRRAYGGGKADHYREWLIENAARFGLDAAQVRKMKQPMLIRQGLGEYDRAEFARQANESAVSAMSETEQARSDAARMPDLEGLEVNDSGEMLQGASSAFIRDFLRTVVSPNERNAMVTADGKLSQRGAMRIRNAIFAKAYGDADIVAMLTEATDGNVKNILAGMLRSSPGVARIRELIAAGARPPVEFVPDLLDAVRRFSKAREDGMKVEQVLAQAGMFGDEASPRVAELMRELEDNARAPKRVAEMIQRFVDEIDQQGDPRQGGIFDGGEDGER